MRRALALASLVLLAGCDADRTAARDWLSYRGFSRIELRALPVLDRPCEAWEPFAIGFTASADGKRWQGAICAMSDGLQDARLPEPPREVGRAPAWDSFGRAEP